MKDIEIHGQIERKVRAKRQKREEGKGERVARASELSFTASRPTRPCTASTGTGPISRIYIESRRISPSCPAAALLSTQRTNITTLAPAANSRVKRASVPLYAESSRTPQDTRNPSCLVSRPSLSTFDAPRRCDATRYDAIRRDTTRYDATRSCVLDRASRLRSSRAAESGIDSG